MNHNIICPRCEKDTTEYPDSVDDCLTIVFRQCTVCEEWCCTLCMNPYDECICMNCLEDIDDDEDENDPDQYA